MGGLFGYVRPYPGRLGTQTQEFVESIGFSLCRHGVLPAGTSDELTARFIQRLQVELVVIPFHLHRGPNGEVLDGFSALLDLKDHVSLARTTFFMPVRSFSWGASFQRRLDVLKSERYWLCERLLIAHQDELGTATLASRLTRFVDMRADSKAAPSLSSFPPSSSFKAADSRRDAPPSSYPAANSGTHRISPERLRWEERGVDSSIIRSEEGKERQDPEPESARERFRKAAEIGARARREAEKARARSKRKQ